jgi:hypothetical protein
VCDCERSWVQIPVRPFEEVFIFIFSLDIILVPIEMDGMHGQSESSVVCYCVFEMVFGVGFRFRGGLRVMGLERTGFLFVVESRSWLLPFGCLLLLFELIIVCIIDGVDRSLVLSCALSQIFVERGRVQCFTPPHSIYLW